MDTLYYIARDGEQQGPYTVTQLRNMWQSGTITAHTQYWFEGAASWQPLIRIRTLLEGEQGRAPAPAPAVRHRATTPARPHKLPGSHRRILPALLLWCFLGGFGAHRFYAGRTETGLWMLGLTGSGILLLTLGSGAIEILAVLFLLAVAGWTLIDFIALVTGNFQDDTNTPITQWT